MKIKTQDLIGPALDWAVAQCELMREDYRDRGLLIHRIGYGQPMPPYSTDWSQGGPILEREGIDVMKVGTSQWRADCGPACYGPAYLVAAMRAWAVKKLGHEVDVPDELMRA